MSQEWYYARDNEPMGPVSAAELRRLAVAGDLRPDDLVWHEGLTEWSAARNVRGLFDDEAKPASPSSIGQPAASAAIQAPGVAATVPPPRAAGPATAVLRASGPATAVLRASGPVAATAGATASAAAAPAAANRHFLDRPLDWLRRRFDVPQTETAAKVFWACGSFGIFAGMLLIAVIESLLAAEDAKEQRVGHIIWALQTILALAVLQYLATKVSHAMGRLFRPGPGALASGVLPDCFALLSALAGLTAFLACLVLAAEKSPYVPLLLGLGALMAFGYLAVVALRPAALGVLIAPEVAPAEEAIGVVSFLLRVLLRAMPVAFGAGAIVGALMMAFVCGLGLQFPGESALKTPGAIAPILAAANLARWILLWFAALPPVAYLAFLLGNLVLGLWHSVLSLPGKIDGLAAKKQD